MYHGNKLFVHHSFLLTFLVFWLLSVSGMSIPPQSTGTMSSSVAGDESKKQGAYGKIPTHKESPLIQILHPEEVISMIRYKLREAYKPQQLLQGEDEAISFCREILVSVSRSFAAVIQSLPKSLVLDICVFYLVLRALDTIEDDMDVPVERKRHLLSNFVSTALADPQWSLQGVGAGDEQRLLQDFPKLHKVYMSLPEESKLVIADITQRMADGMCEFVGADLLQGTQDVEQYNLYCHYVAGLVGEGLSRLFSSSRYEGPQLAKELKLSNSMGLFLQKTNIIRDFLEDYVDKRAFWPQSVWKKYGSSLGDFTLSENRIQALACLNELCTDALELAPDCLTYMSKLQDPDVFNFCAIPQVMAIATLSKCYNNPKVFTGVVKIRRGLSCHLMMQCSDVTGLQGIFASYAATIQRQINKNDPNFNRTMAACDAILLRTQAVVGPHRIAQRMRYVVALLLVTIAASFLDPFATQSLLRHNFFVPTLVVVVSFVYFGLASLASTQTKTKTV